VAGSSTIISVQDVVDVAFVFTPELLQHFWTDVASMTQLYFTQSPTHLPFSVSIIKSYPAIYGFPYSMSKKLFEE